MSAAVEIAGAWTDCLWETEEKSDSRIVVRMWRIADGYRELCDPALQGL